MSVVDGARGFLGSASRAPVRPPAPIDVEGAFEANTVALIELTRRSPWAEVGIEPDVAWGLTGIPGAAFNSVTAARFTPESADQRIREVLEVFERRELPVSWWVGPGSTPADLVERLRAAGFTGGEEPTPGMALDLRDWQAPPARAGFEVERVRDRVGFEASCEVLGEAFGMGPDLVRMTAERLADVVVGDGPARVFVVREAGWTVATSLGLAADGVLGIYNVATVPAARRRGAGAAATIAALEDGVARGCRLAILEATDAGVPLYERLGFRTAVGIRTLAWEPPASS